MGMNPLDAGYYTQDYMKIQRTWPVKTGSELICTGLLSAVLLNLEKLTSKELNGDICMFTQLFVTGRSLWVWSDA